MNVECYIGGSFAKSDLRGNSYIIIFIWRYILAQEHTPVVSL